MTYLLYFTFYVLNIKIKPFTFKLSWCFDHVDFCPCMANMKNKWKKNFYHSFDDDDTDFDLDSYTLVAVAVDI